MSWLRRWFVERLRPRHRTGETGRSFRPRLEELERREVMSANPVTYQLQSNGNLLQTNATGSSVVVDQNVKSFEAFTTPAGQTNLFDLHTDGVLWEVLSTGVHKQIRARVQSADAFGDGKGGTMLVLLGQDSSLWLQKAETGWQFNVQASGVSWAKGVADSNGTLARLLWLTSDGKCWQMDQAGARKVINPSVASIQSFSDGKGGTMLVLVGLDKSLWLQQLETGWQFNVQPSGVLWANGVADANGVLSKLYWLTSDNTFWQMDQSGARTAVRNQLTTLLAGLPDASLHGLTLELEVGDGQLSRADVISLFREVEADGVVTANELTSLQTLLNLATQLNMPAYVQDLAGKIVNGDPANQNYQGSPLGNLSAGSTGAKLEKLVDKWFYGSDHPNPTDDTGFAGYTYQLISGPLFHAGNTVNYGDIVQGMVGDCYFLSALADLAVHQPTAVVGLFIDNHDALNPGDDTYTLRFWNPTKNAWSYLTVDQWLPLDSSGHFAFANFKQLASDPNKVLWVALLEKGFAQANESGWLGRTPSNSYHGISSGWPVTALLFLTGHAGTHASMTASSAVLAIWNNKGAISFNVSTGNGNPNVVQYHAYSLVAYDPATGLFTLFNPWGLAGGYSGSQFKPGILKMTWSQLVQTFDTWDGITG
jgi:hypothetical protein